MAVDTLLGFDPDDDALRTFLRARGADIDETQRVRIEERLALTSGNASHPP
jgi:trimethylamine:corrinoid methyltransferase-like protein